MTELIPPSDRWKDAFLAVEEEFEAGTHPSAVHRQPEESFDGYVRRVQGWARGDGLPDGWVPLSVLWLVDGDEWIGRVTLRHELNAALRTWGGHIGYEIRPSRRRIGYGTRALRLALIHAAVMGIDPCLVTCFADNIGSRRVIEANAGDLEASYLHEGRPALRYWVPAPR
jgi:predicted acetyltransferase